jgi:hypothetical protein
MQQNLPTSLQGFRQIRQLLDRPSKFTSITGLSGIFAGLYAIVGSIAAFYYINIGHVLEKSNAYLIGSDDLLFFFADAAIVFVFAAGTAVFLTRRKAQKDGRSIFDESAKTLMVNLCIPLLVGTIFCLSLIWNNNVFYLAPAMLIFYGLALLNAAKYTLDNIRILGVAQLALGLIASFTTEYGLLFWAAGFGCLHIAYGVHMYVRYEK